MRSQATPRLRHDRDGFALIAPAGSSPADKEALRRLVAMRRRRLTLFLKMRAAPIVVRNERRMVRAAADALRSHGDSPSRGAGRTRPHAVGGTRNHTTSIAGDLS